MPGLTDDAKFHERRESARAIFFHAIAEASISKGFARHVNCERGVLRVREDLYNLQSFDRVSVISIGKAGHTMVEALTEQVGSSLEGIVASSVEPAAQVRGFRYFLGGHPTPNEESIQAASAILRVLGSQTPSSLVIFLVSGGGSSIVEKPIDDEISLADLVATYRALVLSGAPIAEINSVRKHLSAVKGGRLAQAAFPAQQVSLLVSDVPDNAPDALASGPTMPDTTSIEDCYRIVDKYDLLTQFPKSTRELFERHALDETPKSDDPVFHRARWWPILSNQTALEEASEAAERAGFYVHVDNSCDDWDYEKAAEYLVQRVRELREKFSPVCLLSGGEVTVRGDIRRSWWQEPAVCARMRRENRRRQHRRAQCRDGRDRRQQSCCGVRCRWKHAYACAREGPRCPCLAREVRRLSVAQRLG